MVHLRLARLPERTPVKLTISISPSLNQSLADYAALYAATYGSDEPVTELVPAILTTFLEGDKGFTRWCREASDRNG